MSARIVVVVGDGYERDYLARVLTRHQYKVEAVASDSAALSLLHETCPDIALIDLETVEMDGLEMVERFCGAGISTVVLSRAGQLERALQAVKRGAFDYVEKPLRDLDALLVTLQRALEVQALIRENRETAQRLEQAECMSELGQMMASVAHEIRNPLVAIGSLARRIVKTAQDEQAKINETADGQGATESYSRYARIIVDQTQRLDRMVTDLLDYANLRSPEMEEVGIGECFGKVVKLLLPQVEDRSITLIDEIDPKCRIHADGHQIEQIFINLVQNALDAMPEGGMIHVHDQVDEKAVQVRFRDTGSGIPESVDRRKIFDPFYTTKRCGSGLGLAVTHRIMESHRGRVEIEKTDSSGTTFLLTFPRIGSLPKEEDHHIETPERVVHT